MPQLAQPAWRFLIGKQRQLKVKVEPPSVAAQKAERREQRKKLRAALRNGKSGLLLTLAVRAA